MDDYDFPVSESFSSSPTSRKRMKPLLACSHRDWSELPKDILFSIIDRLFIDDCVRFSVVCIPWRTLVLQKISSKSRLPFLLIVPPPPGPDHQHRLLYSLSRKRVYDFRLQVPHNKICRGSSFGWLITLERIVQHDDFQIQLHNPFLNRIIHLPPLDYALQKHPDDVNYDYPWEGYDLYKAVLSSDPCSSPNDFVVMAIMTRYRGLAFFKPGNTTWTPISIGANWHIDFNQYFRVFVDVIFFHKTNQFYALLTNATVVAIDILGDKDGNPKLTQVIARPPPIPRPCISPYYLVEDLSTGDLFMVYKEARSNLSSEEIASRNVNLLLAAMRNVEFERPRSSTITVKFFVFKLDTTHGLWTLVDDLGGNIMFVGSNGSVLRSASDCPGCEPNCIYYIEDQFGFGFERYGPPYDGVYNLKDGMVQPHYSFEMSTIIVRKVRGMFHPHERSKEVMPHAIWLEPTLKI